MAKSLKRVTLKAADSLIKTFVENILKSKN
jgi:hypothetical protein